MSGSSREIGRYVVVLATVAGLTLLTPRSSGLQADAAADVVVIVDTSTSMKQPQMDPQRTSLLVTKLLADIVPGQFAAVRLLDLATDQNLVHSRDTGEIIPCSEDPSKPCHHVIATSDWYGDARQNRYGVLVRPTRGDTSFKQQLDQHLAPVINNSLFGLAFRSAQGVFDNHGAMNANRMIIWLSDGATDDQSQLSAAGRELTSAGVSIEPVVFGQGKVEIANELGLAPKRVRNSSELIKAFADAFRRIVQAPYEVDNLLTVNPNFEMKPGVDEAWVVVYGDDSLQEVIVDSPEGPRPANFAQDRLTRAGAYRVLHVEHPTAGMWKVRAVEGGAVAYAVIQRSALIPVFLEPRTAVVGVPTRLAAGIGTPRSG